MTTTNRSNIIIPELLTEAIQGQFVGQLALAGTKAAIINWTLPISGAAGVKLKGGDLISIPYFNTLGDLDDIAIEGDALSPAALSMSKEQAQVSHAGKAFEITSWAQFTSQYADPYGEAARQFVEMVMRWVDAKLLVAAAAALPASNVLDLYSQTAPVNLDYTTMVKGRMKWGDEQQKIAMITVHSDVFGNLLAMRDSVGRPLLVLPTDDSLPRYNGIPVMVSDRNTKDTTVNGTPLLPKYTSLIVKENALVYWGQGAPVPKTDSDILADTEVTAIHVYGVAYRYLRTPGATRPGVIAVLTNG